MLLRFWRFASLASGLKLNFLAGFDMRPFLYPSRFPWQFRKIDDVAALLPDRSSVETSIELERKTKTE